MNSRDFRPGFRCSAGDAVILMAAFVAAWWFWSGAAWLSRVILYVVLSFFLFCNVFRVGRTGELIWAAVFVALSGYRLRTGAIEWWVIYAVSTALLLAVIAVELRKPSYHGIGWRCVNPGLEEWWRGQPARERDAMG